MPPEREGSGGGGGGGDKGGGGADEAEHSTGRRGSGGSLAEGSQVAPKEGEGGAREGEEELCLQYAVLVHLKVPIRTPLCAHLPLHSLPIHTSCA